MEIYIPQIVATIVVLFLLYVSKYLIGQLINKYGNLFQKAESRKVHVRQLLNVLLNILFVFILAIIWGVEPKNLLIGLSSVFAIIGVAMFAQWSILSNITAGIILFFTSPYHIGDRIKVLDKDLIIEATIENIQTFYTHLRTDDNELIVLPNNMFLQKTVSFKKV